MPLFTFEYFTTLLTSLPNVVWKLPTDHERVKKIDSIYCFVVKLK